MKLPEITQEIVDEFGASTGIDTQLIEWGGQVFNLEPQWTQAAIDFARLIVQGEAEKP